MELIEKIKPQPGFQRAFSLCTADVAIAGGAAGAGKTFAELLEASRWVHKPGYSAIIFRRTMPEIRGADGLWDQSTKIFPALDGIPREHVLQWAFPSGARVDFASMDHATDKLKHQGRSYALIEFDELTHFSEDQFWYLFRSLRSTCGVKPYVRATCNPDPDSFVRDLIDWWIDIEGYPIPERAGVLRWMIRDGDNIVWADSRQELLDRYPGVSPESPRSFTFIPGTLQDNQILMQADPSYLENLKALQYVDRMQMLKGNWNVRASAGLFFQRSWFDVVDAAPVDAKNRWRAWDLAATEAKAGNDPDWSVGVLMSRTRQGRIIIEHVERFRGSPLQVEESIRKTAALDGPNVSIGLWQDPGSAGKSNTAHLTRLLSGYHVRSRVANKDKITYAKPFSSQAEAGNVAIVRGIWNRAYLEELEGFPDRTHDDQVDASSLAFMNLAGNRTLSVVSNEEQEDIHYTPNNWVCDA